MERIDETTRLLAAARGGDRDALGGLFTLVHEELRQIAHRQLGSRRANQTLGTTALVHEAYLKLVDRARISPEDRRHFLATAARAMRQIIVDYARTSRAQKRGGGDPRISLDDVEDAIDAESVDIEERASTILVVHEALGRLSMVDARLGQVVELRFFGGFSVNEVADMLQTSPRTVKRDWRLARAFLYRELHDTEAA
jgi:RNA polymerase sigma factor (TIGR02999 family)